MPAITGKVPVRCPACGIEREAELVQSINARTDPDAKARLLAGELNVLICQCGRRTPLAATLVYVDPLADFYCQVVTRPDAMTKAILAYRQSGATGTRRIVASQNALVEKIKILDAGLLDWAIELAKVSLGDALFDRADDELHWIVRDRVMRGEATSRADYEQLAALTPPAADDYVIDRAWALRHLPS